MTHNLSERILRPSCGFAGLKLAELWRFRELLWLLAWRDILVRYKQTYLGVAWAVLQPVLTMVVFSVLFGRLAKFNSWGAPYPILTMAALIPWNFFANAPVGKQPVAGGVGADHLEGVFSAANHPDQRGAERGARYAHRHDAADRADAVVWRGFFIQAAAAAVVFLTSFFAAFAVGVWFSALNVKYRDVRYIVPFIVRMGMYIAPVGFLWQTIVPQKWWLLYHLNPLVGAIDGFRWCVLGDTFAPWWPGFWMGVGVTLVLLVTGLAYFRQVERTFADIV